MSSIPNLNTAYAADRPQIIGRIGQQTPATTTTVALGSPAQKSDTVELSSEALSAAANADTARAERIARIKSQIQAGTYDEESKLVFAADRIARQLRNG